MAYMTMRAPNRPRSDWSDRDEDPVLAREVVVSDDAPMPTGLVDQSGTPIFRVADKIRMGFVP